MFKKLLLAASALVSINAFAQPPQAALCAGCHGQNGISAIPMYPNLAGQKKQYLEDQLKKFKSGERPNAIMKGMVASLSDADMKALAEYYANMK
ncbi:c-type cytochrome [Catenovulum maritimum]|uniref:Cytochrome c domain-containing protein n=1 Tax=Catenovulum maritimum TaxID=1513271 RepID=A0A0J8H0A3_9ALTE|nr:cytochrome c [Catenovulum maritimum]KMT66443.1 hypothetical protein XM47_02550 [Catenovulum maritimum]